MESRRSGKAEASSSSSHSEYGETRPLNLGCRIFISHSGRNKDFVRHLHDKLVNRLYYDDGTVFFDEKSLPTAEPISMTNILAEARGCELGVLVLTEDFFLHTPNPMLELETLTASNVRLLPLFFKMSVDEFKKMRRNNVWEDQWKAWLKEDEERLRVWKHAVSFVDRFSGLEYCKLANDLAFIRTVVAEVARIVRPISPFSEDGVWGMDRLCELVNDMYKQCALNRVSDNGKQIASTSTSAGRKEADNGNSYDLVGVYGFAGLGKSTLCRCLCNYYCAEFHGKVCCLDLGSIPDSSQASSQTYPSMNPFMWRMQYLLSKLTSHIDHAQSLTFFEIQNLLGKLITKKPIFLAIDNIDNIWSDLKFLEEVDFYLSCNFAKGSKVFITARSENILERVIREYIRFSTMIEHIPKLKFEEARGIFVQKNPKILQMSNMEDEVKECVSMCIIHSDNHPHHQREVDDEWYHPLMLKSSAASIRYDRRRNVDLKLRLREFIQSATAIDKSDARKAVFALLDITYAILSDEAKKVLLDLSLIYKVNARELRVHSSLYTWIQCLYSHVDMKKLENIFSSLEDLSFIDIVEVDHYDGPVRKFIRMHDLMVDFSMYKAMQGAGAAGFTPHYLVLENDAQVRNQAAFRFLLSGALTRNEWPSVSALPKSIRTVSISDLCSSDLEQLDLRSLEGVEVLHLVDNPGVQEVLLSRTTLAHLRSLIIVLNHGVHGCLRLTIDEDWPTPPTASSQIPMGGKLAWVELRGNVILSTCRKSRPWWSGGEQSLLQRLGISRSTTAPHAVCGLGILQPLFCNLQYLALSDFPATRSIDLTTCTSLKGLDLRDMSGLRDIHGLETLINLDELKILYCDELLLLSIPANPRLSAYVIDCRSLKRISLLRTSYPGETN